MKSSVNNDENGRHSYGRYVASLLIAIFGGVVGGVVVLILSSVVKLNEVLPQAPTLTPAPTQYIVPVVEEISFDISTAVTDAVARVAPAVVTVINHLPPKHSFFGNLIEQSGSGSGAIISEDGYIITNYHVVQDAEQLEVVLADGTILPAELIGVDPYGDLAIIQAEAEMPGVANWGNSDALKPGETVIAIGSPLGAFKNTVTVGVVSATGRSIETDRRFELEGLIQTDAAINQGNSGGPLVNLAGQIVGINTIIVRGNGDGSAIAEGLGFAVPSNVSRAVAKSLILEGSIARPYLGANWGVITPDVAERFGLSVEYGIYLSEIAPGSPADEAGLLRGDILVAIDDQPIDPDHPFINKLFQYSPGDEITLGVVRDGDQFNINLELGKR
jgi:2-alkenal reductase